MAENETVGIGFRGGLNDAVDPSQIRSSELAVCLNWDFSENVQGGSRRGHPKYNATRFKDAASRLFKMLGITSFPYQSGTYRDVFVGQPQGGGSMELRYVSGQTATQVSFANSITVGTAGYPYSFETVVSRLIGVNGDTTNWTWNGDTTRNAQALGIAAPATAPSVAEGVAGAITGTRRYVVCFYDSTDQVLGAPSPISASITVSAKKINLTGVLTSTNPRVAQRKIYCTNTTGVGNVATGDGFFLLTTITNNTGTTYTDNSTDAALGIVLKPGGQPPNCRIAVAYRGVLWLFNSPTGNLYSYGFYSQPAEPESFIYGADNAKGYIDFGSDGGAVTGAYVAYNQMIVMQERKISHVTGDRASNYNLQEIAKKVGQRWVFAGVQIDQDIVFADKLSPYQYNTSQLAKLLNDRGYVSCQGTWDTIGNLEGSASGSIGEEVRGAHIQQRRQVWFSFRNSNNAGPNNQTLVWNYKIEGQPWSLYDFGFDCHGTWMANFSNVPTVMISTEEVHGWIFEADSGDADRVDDGGTLSGTVTGGTATTLTASAATFATTGEGLIGAKVRTFQATTGVVQEATITANTATQLTVSSWPTHTPASGDTFAIGSVKVQLKTGRMHLGDPESEKRTKEFRMRMEAA